MKKKRKKTIITVLYFILLIVLIFILILFFIRLILPKQIDDVTPGIQCDRELLNKVDIFYVIPIFNNTDISKNQTWCKKILSLNKTLRLHGVHHTYEEFKTKRDKEYLDQGINSFEQCFGYKPDHFKPPQLAISKQNIKLIKNSGLKLDLNLNQIIHKVYHCNDTGVYKNKWADWF